MSILDVDSHAADASEPQGRSLRLWRVVLSISQPPEPPGPGEATPVRRPTVAGFAENLVFEFDEAYTAFVDGFVELPTEAQLLALQAMDRQLSAMVRAKDAALWTERARRDDPVWQDVRILAIRVLAEFDWPIHPA